jgi:hypothetical protein
LQTPAAWPIVLYARTGIPAVRVRDNDANAYAVAEHAIAAGTIQPIAPDAAAVVVPTSTNAMSATLSRSVP